jgi:hypothetical protein
MTQHRRSRRMENLIGFRLTASQQSHPGIFGREISAAVGDMPREHFV